MEGSSAADLKDLDGNLSGRLATPADDDWDAARQAWNLAADQRPEAVAFVESADDVAAVVRAAGEAGLGVAAQGTGHAAAPLGPLEGAVLVKTEGMRAVEVDAEAGTARVEAGVIARELMSAAQEAGRCSLPGSSPDVGVIGYTLGGGLSWLGRRFGFACNSVRAVELVTPDGEARRVDADTEPDLFWALRGGGGSFGVVTALDVDLVPVGEVFAGTVIYPADDAQEMFRRYREWAEDVPDEVTSIARLLRLPPLEEIPEPLRDRPVVTLGAACLMDEKQGSEMVAPLRELGEPVMDTFARIPASQLVTIHMDPEQPVPAIGDYRLIRELPEEAVDAFVEAAGPDSGSPLLVAELRHVGGALGRPAEGGGALASLDAAFALLGVGSPMAPEQAEAISRHLDKVCGAMSAWTADGGYLNFAERPADSDAIFPSETARRLSEVRRRWDPDGMMRSNHPVTLEA